MINEGGKRYRVNGKLVSRINTFGDSTGTMLKEKDTNTLISRHSIHRKWQQRKILLKIEYVQYSFEKLDLKAAGKHAVKDLHYYIIR